MQYRGFALTLLWIVCAWMQQTTLVCAQEENAEPINAGLLEEVDENEKIIGFSVPEVKERLSYLSGCTPLKYDNIVTAYLQTYLYKKPEKTRAMLSRMPMYFHLFESELKAAGMPDDLKYLSVTESALNPLAVSHCGATGLWQFMPATGSEYGLEQNSAIDERSDPVMATRAALKYLKKLYNSYGDWALALAAYNSGPGNVNRAIKRAHSKNFWAIRKYLPRETCNYVPAFISATYICNFYMMHNLMPDYPDLDYQITAYTKVFDGVAFQEICDATGLDFNTVVALNPGYKKFYVPAQTQGRFIMLPVRVMDAFNNYLRSKGAQSVSADFSHIKIGSDAKERYKAKHYSIANGDQADRLAQSFGCFKSHLVAWNHLPYSYATAGKNILVWHPNTIKEYQKIQVAAPKQQIDAPHVATSPAVKPKPATSPLPGKEAPKVENKEITIPGVPSTKTVLEEEKKFVWHVVQRNESLSDIAFMYQTQVIDIQMLNGAEKFGIGARIKVKKVTK
jgi:membrane-bound lytic murein transglycosylase D